MKITIKNKSIPRDFIGRLPPSTNYIDGDKIEYEVSDDFIRDLRFSCAGAQQDNYTSMLIRLMFKADNINMYRLSEAYPAECLTISMYKNDPEFYKQILN
jgi:hypothetical protein